MTQLNTPKGYLNKGSDRTESFHCGRTKVRSPEEIQKLIYRLNRIEGQIRGIRGMVEKSCCDPDTLPHAPQVKRYDPD